MDDDASVFGGDSPERQLLARGGRLWRCAEPVRLLGVQLDQHFEYDAVRDTKPPSFATVRRPIRSSASRDLVTISPQACLVLMRRARADMFRSASRIFQLRQRTCPDPEHKKTLSSCEVIDGGRRGQARSGGRLAEEDGSRTHLRPSNGPTRI